MPGENDEMLDDVTSPETEVETELDEGSESQTDDGGEGDNGEGDEIGGGESKPEGDDSLTTIANGIKAFQEAEAAKIAEANRPKPVTTPTEDDAKFDAHIKNLSELAAKVEEEHSDTPIAAAMKALVEDLIEQKKTVRELTAMRADVGSLQEARVREVKKWFNSTIDSIGDERYGKGEPKAGTKQFEARKELYDQARLVSRVSRESGNPIDDDKAISLAHQLLTRGKVTENDLRGKMKSRHSQRTAVPGGTKGKATGGSGAKSRADAVKAANEYFAR